MPQIRPMKQEIKVKQYGRVDLVVCLDTTGSMNPIIDAVREHITTHLIGELNNQLSRNQMPLEWQARIVGFGNRNADPFYSTNFTNNEKDLVQAIYDIPTFDGTRECSLDALLDAARSSWRTDVSTHRIVVLFTDEPSYPEVDPAYGGGDVEDVIQELLAQKIKLFLFGPEDKIFSALRKLPKAEITLPQDGDVHGMMRRLDFSKVFEQMAKTISGEMITILQG